MGIRVNATSGKRSFRSIVRVVATRLLAASLLAAGFLIVGSLQAPPSEAEGRSVPIFATDPTPPITAQITEELVTQRDRITDQATTTAARVSEDKADSVSTAKLTELAEAHAEVVQSTAELLPFELHDQLGLLNGYVLTHGEETILGEVETAADEVVDELEATAVAWETELVAEKERIRIAEEKRKAEEAARKAAAEAAAAAARASHTPSGGYSAAPRSSSSSDGGGESAQARISRLAGHLPFRVPYHFGSCGAASQIACYYVGGSIVVNANGLGSMRDCRVIYGLAHEYKHLLQYQAGQIQYSGGQISNHAWLEADAMAFGYRYGCR